ncbi:sugar phosphate nucleotidyltransferase [Balneolales bacterium ANBcel1]|nr:sugar phosphate nucleotidyltransferase [Balneolales bacterium ANBcel1]
MAGKGTRLRPHTLTTPKPLLPVAGTMLIERIIGSFAASLDREISEIAFVLGDFGKDVEQQLSQMTQRFGAKASFYYQLEALGTAHAVNCAAESLTGEVIVAFADTLFEVDGAIDLEGADSVIWLKKVEDPSRYGVALLEEGQITGFVEKPSEPVSDMAIIGVYYFRDGERLQKELQYLMDNDIRGHKSEFDLTDAIDRLLKQNAVFRPADVSQWLDFGTIPAWISSTAEVLERMESRPDLASRYPGSTIIQPCHIGDGVTIKNSVIGPCASIGDGCSIEDSEVSHSIILDRAVIRNSQLERSTVGSAAEIEGCRQEIHLGDYSTIRG